MSDKNKSVLVIGGGVAGIQASLDLAEMGIKTYLVEKEPSIGGRMAQLDKTFPTMDCSICILAPKMMECYRHENIEILSYSEVVSVEGETGSFKVKVLRKARYVDENRCNGCGECAKVCPMGILNKFDMNLGVRGAAYIPFMQAVPLIYVLDRHKCMRCGLCKVVCGLDAIDYNQEDEEIELNVSAIIVATGFDCFDPSKIPEYGYRKYDNVITSLEYERLICAAGPSGGHLERLSDLEIPDKVAFIQCVGSRDLKHNPYCCSVCCMYATKEAMLIKEHYPGTEVYIFYIDLRALGKRFHEFVERAKEEYGVRYIRSKPSEITENEGKNLIIWYEDTVTREINNLEVGMVILCPTLIPSEGVEKLSNVLGVKLDEYGFFRVDNPFHGPTNTTRDGIFVAGYAQSPKDIPESIAQASGAAGRCAEIISTLGDQNERRKT